MAATTHEQRASEFSRQVLDCSLPAAIYDSPDLAMLALADIERAIGRFGNSVGTGQSVVWIHERVFTGEAPVKNLVAAASNGWNVIF